MSFIRSSNIPVGIIFIVGVLVTSAYFIDVPAISEASNFAQSMAVILTAFATGVGAISMIRLHGNNIMRKREGQWYLSVVFFIALILMFVTAIADIQFLKHPWYLFIVNNFYNPLTSSFYAILGFFIVSASYRAMRARSIESGLLLITGVIVMLRNAPIGNVIWTGFPVIGTWLLNIPNTAGNRAVFIGVGVGTILLGLRVLLGYERSYLGET
jgi:hypothetical protein